MLVGKNHRETKTRMLGSRGGGGEIWESVLNRDSTSIGEDKKMFCDLHRVNG